MQLNKKKLCNRDGRPFFSLKINSTSGRNFFNKALKQIFDLRCLKLDKTDAFYFQYHNTLCNYNSKIIILVLLGEIAMSMQLLNSTCCNAFLLICLKRHLMLFYKFCFFKETLIYFSAFTLF